MSSIQDVLNRLEFTAKLYRMALEGKHPYKPAEQLLAEFGEVRAQAETELATAAKNDSVAMAERLLLVRIVDEVGRLERATQVRQSP